MRRAGLYGLEGPAATVGLPVHLRRRRVFWCPCSIMRAKRP